MKAVFLRSPSGMFFSSFMAGVLVDRQRFTCQRSFLDLQIDRFQQAQICRDVVARFEEDDITWHEFPRRDSCSFSIAHHMRFRRSQFLQGCQGFFGAAFLDNSKDCIQDDNGQDG